MSVVEDIIELEEDEDDDDDAYYNPPHYNNSSNNNKDVFNSASYNELQRVLTEAVKNWTAATMSSSDRKDNSFVNSNIKSLNKMDQQQDSKNKCIKEAEEAAPLAMLRPHKASESTTSSTSTSPTTGTEPVAAGPVGEGEGEGEEQPALSSLDINNLQTPQTLGEALSMLNKLQTMKDDLLAEPLQIVLYVV